MYNFKAECDKLHILSFNGGNNWTAKRYCARIISARLNKLILTYLINSELSFRFD